MHEADRVTVFTLRVKFVLFPNTSFHLMLNFFVCLLVLHFLMSIQIQLRDEIYEQRSCGKQGEGWHGYEGPLTW